MVVTEKISPNRVHRRTAMLMLTSPSIERGRHHTDAVFPIHMATTVKVDSTKTMEAAFKALLNFNPETMDDLPALEQIYRRIGSPTEINLNWAITLAEGVSPEKYWAMSFSDGMRAINAAIEFQMNPGDEIVITKPLYGCTDSYFSELAPHQRGYLVKTVDLTEPEKIVEALSPKTKIIYFETVTNPNLRVYDLETISRLAKKENPNILVIVDNTFPGPVGCNPLLHGADIVVHSVTKIIGGFSQEMMGLVVLPKALWMKLFLHRKDTGGVPGPEQEHNVLTRGLPTIYERFLVMQDNADYVARFLQQSSHIRSVSYPGLRISPFYEVAKKLLTDWDRQFAPGYMVAFVPESKTEKQRVAKARLIVDYIAKYGNGVITHAVSLGGIKSLIQMPFIGTHAVIPDEEKMRWGIDPSLIRFSAGLGDRQDLVDLLEQAVCFAYR